MLRMIAVVLFLLGAWYLVAGIVSILGVAGQSGGVPPMTTAAGLGALLLVVAILLWRRGAPGQRGRAAERS